MLCSVLHRPLRRFTLAFLACLVVRAQEQPQDPSRLNGGSCLAMAGHECVALILDSRFGSGGSGLVNVQARHVLLPPSQEGMYAVAFQGLQGDVLTLEQEMTRAITKQSDTTTLTLPGRTQLASKTLSPRTLASWTSRLLYQHRNAPYYVEPLIVGLERVDSNNDNNDTPRHQPYLCSMDLLGSLQEQPPFRVEKKTDGDDEASSLLPQFCCMGAAVPSLYGTAQAFWKPRMSEKELQDTIVKAFLAALERDCMSGYGARLYLLTPDKGWTVHDVLTRND